MPNTKTTLAVNVYVVLNYGQGIINPCEILCGFRCGENF